MVLASENGPDTRVTGPLPSGSRWDSKKDGGLGDFTCLRKFSALSSLQCFELPSLLWHCWTGRASGL